MPRDRRDRGPSGGDVGRAADRGQADPEPSRHSRGPSGRRSTCGLAYARDRDRRRGSRREEADQRSRPTSSPRRCAGSRRPPRAARSTTRTRSSSAATRRCGARSGWSPAAGPGTSRCTAASSGPACSTRRARARCSPRRCPTRCVAATQAVDGGAGVLHIVKNYTGDVMNFEMAAELAAADRRRGRRGRRRRRRRRRRTASTPPGGAASAPRSCWRRSPGRPPTRAATWPAVAEVARKVNANGRSMGMALTSCTVPAAGRRRSTCPTTRWRSASASTASPAAAGCRSRRPARSPRCWSSRSSTTSTSPAATACSRSSTAWAARRCWSSTSCTARSPRSWQRPGVQRGALAGRALHHQPGHGRLLGHPAQAGRRAAAPVGRPGQHRPACAGGVTENGAGDGGPGRAGPLAAGVRGCRDGQRGRPDGARLGDRRRRPRQQHATAA